MSGGDEQFRPLFIRADLIVVNERGPDEVEPFHQCLLRDFVDRKLERLTIYGYGLIGQIESSLCTGSHSSKDGMTVCGQLDEEQSAVGRILPEDVAIAGRLGRLSTDDGFESRLLNCPNRMFAR